MVFGELFVMTCSTTFLQESHATVLVLGENDNVYRFGLNVNE